MSSFGRFTQALGGVVETLSYASPLLTLTQSVGTSPLTATIAGIGGISGSGTTNYLPKFTGSTIIGNSSIQDSGSLVSIGVSTLINTGTANQNTKIFGNKVGISRISDGAEVVYFSKTAELGIFQGTANIFGYDGIQFRTQGAETVKATLTSEGNFGIGTTPATKFHIQDTNGGIFFDGSGATYNRFKSTTSSASTGRDLLFSAQSAGTTPDLYITSGGNVLIGTTTNAGYKLDVNGTARISGALLISNNDITQDGTRPIFTLKQSGTSKLLLGIASTASDIIVGDSIGDVDFRTNSQAFNFSVNNGGGIAFKLASNAQATFSSSVYLGTSTIDASAKFQVDSTTQGVLVPRMNEDDINAIASPADGLLVYNLDQQVHCFWDSASWHKYTHTNM